MNNLLKGPRTRLEAYSENFELFLFQRSFIIGTRLPIEYVRKLKFFVQTEGPSERRQDGHAQFTQEAGPSG